MIGHIFGKLQSDFISVVCFQRRGFCALNAVFYRGDLQVVRRQRNCRGGRRFLPGEIIDPFPHPVFFQAAGGAFIGCFAVRTCVEITCRNVRQNIPFVVGTVWIEYRTNIARAAIAIIQRFFKVGVVFQNILRKAAGFGRTLLRFQAIGDPAIHRVFECAPAAQRRRIVDFCAAHHFCVAGEFDVIRGDFVPYILLFGGEAVACL